MIEISTRLSQKRIETLAKELSYVSSSSFLNGLALRQKSNSILDYLLSQFPTGSGVSSLNEFGMHLRQGFRADYHVTGAKAFLEIYHVLEDDKRAKTVLTSLDKGSGAYSWIAEKTLHFLADPKSLKGKRRRSKSALVWVTIAEGAIINKKARSGLHYTDRTVKFIMDRILPQLREEFTHKVEARIKRIK